ncbi:hypothetical protein [Asaia platycodi]|uniref:hypothetical protein n=1 Tax=Asaia platycodi TaxID=610243 RepID=UPI000470BCD3|nr:hypothetical protein [Asaia platycodi]
MSGIARAITLPEFEKTAIVGQAARHVDHGLAITRPIPGRVEHSPERGMGLALFIWPERGQGF